MCKRNVSAIAYITSSTNAAIAGHRPVPSEDNELAARCKQGDPYAFTQLVRRHRGGVYRAAYAILGDREDAEDVAQEAFMRAYTAIRSFNHKRSFAQWIWRITVNCAISTLRKRRPITAKTVQGLEPEGAGTGSDPAQHASASDFRTQVRQALATLPPRQQAAISLFALEDMDMASVATVMGCAPGTVRVHVHRARQRLRELLGQYLEGDEPSEM